MEAKEKIPIWGVMLLLIGGSALILFGIGLIPNWACFTIGIVISCGIGTVMWRTRLGGRTYHVFRPNPRPDVD